jgi:hypothetical protein
MLKLRWSFRHSALSDWRVALATALSATALLAACGGGGGDAGTPATGGTATAASYALGPISGFGSVIVGGVRFDDSSAAVSDEDGNAHDRSALKLGMLVQVDAGTVDHTAATATALRVRFGSEIVGPVGTIDSAASTVLVLGQTVLVTTSTLFDSSLSGGLTALTAGAVVEVHGILDQSTGRITATRIEPKAGATFFRLRGVLAALDTTLKTFKIGSELISYAGLAAADVPSGLANGQVVRVQLQTTQTAGAWVATKLRGGARVPDTPRDAHLEGAITAFTSSAAFEVNGLKVDATNATFPDGTSGLVVGARVEVEGNVNNGVLVATKVEIEERRTMGRRPLELRGELGNLNATDKTFALRGVTVWFGGTVVYTGGTEATLANGRRVEVKGVLSTDRTRLEAQRIEFK